jgi:hypothetical protein
MKCKYCQREMATESDYETIPEGEGEHLCWRDYGERCIDADTALDNARAEIATLKRLLWPMVDCGRHVMQDDGIVFVHTSQEWICEARKALMEKSYETSAV